MQSVVQTKVILFRSIQCNSNAKSISQIICQFTIFGHKEEYELLLMSFYTSASLSKTTFGSDCNWIIAW
jgi:hypothetical protein